MYLFVDVDGCFLLVVVVYCCWACVVGCSYVLLVVGGFVVC